MPVKTTAPKRGPLNLGVKVTVTVQLSLAAYCLSVAQAPVAAWVAARVKSRFGAPWVSTLMAPRVTGAEREAAKWMRS